MQIFHIFKANVFMSVSALCILLLRGSNIIQVMYFLSESRSFQSLSQYSQVQILNVSDKNVLHFSLVLKIKCCVSLGTEPNTSSITPIDLSMYFEQMSDDRRCFVNVKNILFKTYQALFYIKSQKGHIFKSTVPSKSKFTFF